MRGSTEEINTAYKYNYPRQPALVIEWGIIVDGVGIFLGFEEGKLAYDILSPPEDGA
jgi:hypothetical protein